MTWTKKTWHILRSKKQDNEKIIKTKRECQVCWPSYRSYRVSVCGKGDIPLCEDEEKVPIVIEFLTGETSAEKMVEKYHICSVQTLYAWVGRYVSQENLLSLQNKNYEDMANRSKDDQIRELKAALKKAQKEAELEKLRAKAYDKMIDLAEERFR